MDKNRQIISELKEFFKHNDSSKAVNAVSNVMDKLVYRPKRWVRLRIRMQVHLRSVGETAGTASVLLHQDTADYADSALGKLFACKKDSFYRLMDDGRIDWRRIIYSINRQLICARQR